MSNERIVIGKGGMLTYKYNVPGVAECSFSLFSEVGAPYQPDMRRAVGRLLANRPQSMIETRELDAKPWVADFLVKRPKP